VPDQVESGPPTAPGEFDWSPAFAEAGLDPGSFRPADPRWIPSEPFDLRAEWTGTAPRLPDTPLTVSAAAFRGRLTHFRVLGPWSKPERMEEAPISRALRIARTTLAGGILIIIVTSVYFARRNLRRGRGDRAGALRFAVFLFALGALDYLLGGRRPGDLYSFVFDSLGPGLGRAFLDGVIFWLIYLALEPYMRRRMPELLIGWARLLEGRVRDPRVGRDVLVGGLFGAAVALVFHAAMAASAWLPIMSQTTLPSANVARMGGANPLQCLVALTIGSLEPGVGNFAWYFLLSVLLRRKELAIAALGLVIFLISLGGDNLAVDVPSGALGAALTVFVIVRIGLLATVALWLFENILIYMPPSLDLSSWYGVFPVPGTVLLAAITLFAFRNSVGRQPLVAGSLDD
jgi:hypothetical protein